MSPLRDFVFSCDADAPVGASLRDAQLSYPRGVDGIAAAVNATPVLRIPIDATHRSVVHSLELRLSARWDGEEPDTMCGVREAMLTHSTYARRFRVQLTSEVFKNGTQLCAMNALSHLEVPAIVDDGRPPPESGHFVVYGREYIIRIQVTFVKVNKPLRIQIPMHRWILQKSRGSYGGGVPPIRSGLRSATGSSRRRRAVGHPSTCGRLQRGPDRCASRRGWLARPSRWARAFGIESIFPFQCCSCSSERRARTRTSISSTSRSLMVGSSRLRGPHPEVRCDGYIYETRECTSDPVTCFVLNRSIASG